MISGKIKDQTGLDFSENLPTYSSFLEHFLPVIRNFAYAIPSIHQHILELPDVFRTRVSAADTDNGYISRKGSAAMCSFESSPSERA